MSNNESYQAVLEDLERQRDELTTAINAIRRVMGLGPSTPDDSGSSTGRSASVAQLRSDEFFGMPILQAAKRYLAVRKQATTAPEIAKALKDHGLINESPKFAGTVYSILFREENRGGGSVIQTTGKRWGLAEWYPNRKPKAKVGATQAGESERPEDEVVEDDEATMPDGDQPIVLEPPSSRLLNAVRP